MSTQLESIDTIRGKTSFTEYSGGFENGVCMQITQGFAGVIVKEDEPGFVQLSKDDAKEVVRILTAWVLAD